MMNDLRGSISKGWPPKSRVGKEEMNMTIRADDLYRPYAKDQDPKKLFEKAASWITAIQATDLDSERQELVTKEINEAMIRAIFGSNMIERAGLGWDITVKLCRRVFAGDDIGEIPERDPEYNDQLLDYYRKQQADLKNASAQFILRSRNEVVQHAKAFQRIIHAFVVEKQDLSEDLIKETHKILTSGVPIIQKDFPDIPPEQYGGIYRTIPVAAGNTMFTVPHFVPAKMKEMCEDLRQELAAAEAKATIDPFSVAAKYSLKFVEIHPFRDGNGRMCRLILNAILCRYAGIIVPIGEQVEERNEYMEIKKRASQEMEGHGEYATFVLRRAVTRLRAIKKKLAGKVYHS
jgi:fido (protein-threonine AMPylation protein)